MFSLAVDDTQVEFSLNNKHVDTKTEVADAVADATDTDDTTDGSNVTLLRVTSLAENA